MAEFLRDGSDHIPFSLILIGACVALYFLDPLTHLYDKLPVIVQQDGNSSEHTETTAVKPQVPSKVSNQFGRDLVSFRFAQPNIVAIIDVVFLVWFVSVDLGFHFDLDHNGDNYGSAGLQSTSQCFTVLEKTTKTITTNGTHPRPDELG